MADFHSVKFSERAKICVILTAHISKESDRKIPRAREIALNGNQP